MNLCPKSLSPSPVSFRAAGSTNAGTIGAANESVGLIEGMAFDAMSFSRGKARSAEASQVVNANSDWLEMIRIYTRGIAAQVIENEPVRYWPNQQLISNDVGFPVRFADPKMPVTFGFDAASPLPAGTKMRCEGGYPARFVDLRPKAFGERIALASSGMKAILIQHREPLLSGVMRQAVSAVLPLLFYQGCAL